MQLDGQPAHLRSRGELRGVTSRMARSSYTARPQAAGQLRALVGDAATCPVAARRFVWSTPRTHLLSQKKKICSAQKGYIGLNARRGLTLLVTVKFRLRCDAQRHRVQRTPSAGSSALGFSRCVGRWRRPIAPPRSSTTSGPATSRPACFSAQGDVALPSPSSSVTSGARRVIARRTATVKAAN